MATQQQEQRHDLYTEYCSAQVLNEMRANPKVWQDFQFLEELSRSPNVSLSPLVRLNRAYQLGRDIETNSGKEFPQYTNVARFIRHWIVETPIQLATEPSPVEKHIAETRRSPHDYLNVLAHQNKEYAEQRKEAVKSNLLNRKKALGHLLCNRHLKILMNQITKKTNETLVLEKEKAVKSRHDFFAHKHFSANAVSSSPTTTPQMPPPSAPVTCSLFSIGAGPAATTTPCYEVEVFESLFKSLECSSTASLHLDRYNLAVSGVSVARICSMISSNLQHGLGVFRRRFDYWTELLNEVEPRVKRIEAIMSSYAELESDGASHLLGGVLKHAAGELTDIGRTLYELTELLNKSGATTTQISSEHIKKIESQLRDLGRHLDSYGLFVYGQETLASRTDKLINILRAKSTVPDQAKLIELLGRVRTALQFSGDRPKHTADESIEAQVTHGQSGEILSKIPDDVRNLLELLCSNDIDENTRQELTDLVRRLWYAWELDEKDMFGLEKRKSLGQGATSTVFKSKIQLRGALGEPTAEKVLAAVKELKHIPKNDESDKSLSSFMRELLIQMDAQHPCIVHVFGGFLSNYKSYFDDISNEGASSENEEEEEDNDDLQISFIRPHIVMERMSLNLRTAMKLEDFTDWTLRRRILKDVADGLAYLHARGTVHRDVKPENVLLRRVKGMIVGRAKLGDFGVSRKTLDAGTRSTCASTVTRAGTYLYMPPEVFNTRGRIVSRKSWDVWSFGVLACEICTTGCFDEILSTGSVQELIHDGVLEERLAECANSIEDKIVRGVALCCLKSDRSERPKMEMIAQKLAQGKLTTKAQMGARHRGMECFETAKLSS